MIVSIQHPLSASTAHEPVLVGHNIRNTAKDDEESERRHRQSAAGRSDVTHGSKWRRKV